MANCTGIKLYSYQSNSKQKVFFPGEKLSVPFFLSSSLYILKQTNKMFKVGCRKDGCARFQTWHRAAVWDEGDLQNFKIKSTFLSLILCSEAFTGHTSFFPTNYKEHKSPQGYKAYCHVCIEVASDWSSASSWWGREDVVHVKEYGLHRLRKSMM